MPKTTSEIQAILQEPKKRQVIAKAAAVQDRVRFHSEASLNSNECSTAVTEFLAYVKELLQNYDRYRVFMAMFRYPVDTVPATSEIYDALYKVFDGRDPVYLSDFTTPTAKADWDAYRNEVLKMDWFWRHEAFETLKEDFKSFVVVDLPSEQKTLLPTPYPYFLDVNDVLDYEEREEMGGQEETLEWILFRLDEERVAYFDSMAYQIFETKKGGNEVIGELANVPHELGYCPAAMFWYGEHPLEKYLAKLDKLLFFLVSKDEMDLGNSYPVWWMYETDCDYSHPTTGDSCDGGFLRASTGKYLLSREVSAKGQLVPCPRCGGKFRGAGTVLKLPVPNGSDEKPLGTPAGIINTPVDSLKFHVDEIQRRQMEIYEGVVGKGGEPTNDQAQNEKQVISSFESRTDVLKKFKTNFERIQKWTEETICKLRYGNKFRGMAVNYGQTFYLETDSMLLEQYQKALATNAPDDILDEKLEAYYQTKYRNNPMALQRQRIVSALDPFRHRTLEQVEKLFNSGHIGFEDFYLKFNLSTLIARFERENISILQFGEMLEFNEKINIIKKELINYGKTIEGSTRQQASNGGGNGAGISVTVA